MMGRLPAPNPYEHEIERIKMPSTDINGKPILIFNREEIESIKWMCEPLNLEEEEVVKKIDEFLKETN